MSFRLLCSCFRVLVLCSGTVWDGHQQVDAFRDRLWWTAAVYLPTPSLSLWGFWTVARGGWQPLSMVIWQGRLSWWRVRTPSRSSRFSLWVFSGDRTFPAEGNKHSFWHLTAIKKTKCDPLSLKLMTFPKVTQNIQKWKVLQFFAFELFSDWNKSIKI